MSLGFSSTSSPSHVQKLCPGFWSGFLRSCGFMQTLHSQGSPLILWIFSNCGTLYVYTSLLPGWGICSSSLWQTCFWVCSHQSSQCMYLQNSPMHHCSLVFLYLLPTLFAPVNYLVTHSLHGHRYTVVHPLLCIQHSDLNQSIDRHDHSNLVQVGSSHCLPSHLRWCELSPVG